MVMPAQKTSEIRTRLIEKIESRSVLDELSLKRQIKEIESIPEVAAHSGLKALAYAAADDIQLSLKHFEEAKEWNGVPAYTDLIAFLASRSMMMEAHAQAEEAYLMFRRSCGTRLLRSIHNVSFFTADINLLMESTKDLIAMMPEKKDIILKEAAKSADILEGFQEATGTSTKELVTLLRHAYSLLSEKHKSITGLRCFYRHEDGPASITLGVSEATADDIADLNFDLAFVLAEQDALPKSNIVIKYEADRHNKTLATMDEDW